MHPGQKTLQARAGELMGKVAGGKKQEAAASPMLWKYTDPDGNEFWLKSKRMTVKSPFSGKSFAAKPQREPPSELGRDLREEAKEPPAGAGPGGKTQTKRKPKKAEYISNADVHDLRAQIDPSLVDPDYSIVANYEIHWKV